VRALRDQEARVRMSAKRLAKRIVSGLAISARRAGSSAAYRTERGGYFGPPLSKISSRSQAPSRSRILLRLVVDEDVAALGSNGASRQVILAVARVAVVVSI
jgi:hypothetical protein